MKRLSSAVLILLVTSSFFFSAQDIDLVLSPKEVFVGDEANVFYTFTSNSLFLATITENGSFTFYAPDLFTFAGFDCDCTSLQISRGTGENEGQLYVLSITFYPYFSGSIDLPSFDLFSYIDLSLFAQSSQESLIELSTLYIDIPPFTISPILMHYSDESLRPPKDPVIIPGTTYVLYGLVAGLLLFIAIIIYVLIAFEKIRNKIKKVYFSFFMSPNFRFTLKQFKKLQKKGDSLCVVDFADRISCIVRQYLEKRFYLSFSCACTDEMLPLFNHQFQDMLSEKQSESIHGVYELFLRCDFLRFSGFSSDLHSLSKDERKRLLDKAYTLVVFFEKGEVENA